MNEEDKQFAIQGVALAKRTNLSPWWSLLKRLSEAALMIAYDNGMINRYNPEKEFLDETQKFLTEAYTSPQLVEVETYLAAKSDEDFYDMICGGANQDWPDLVDAVLQSIFEH